MSSRVRVSLLAVALLAVSAAAFAQGNPCETAPSGSPVALPRPFPVSSKFYVATPELGVPGYVDRVEIGTFLKGAAAPMNVLSIPSASMSLAAGTTTCYEGVVDGLIPSTIPAGVEHMVGARVVNGAGASPWVYDPTSFYLAGVPSAPANVRRGR